MAKKEFLVSTANVALFYNGMLACTGTTSLNTSISVSMEEQNVNGGKGNKLLYSYKYGRELTAKIEMAEWKPEFIALNVGSKMFTGMDDVFQIDECVTITGGTGLLKETPIGDVFVQTENGDIAKIELNPDENNKSDNKIEGNKITYGSKDCLVKVTYQYATNVKKVTFGEDSPFVVKCVLNADKHDNNVGKVGEIEIEIPSFQLSGTFDISLEASGTSSTSLEGKALAVDGETCTEGSVYAYLRDYYDNPSNIMTVADIAFVNNDFEITVGEEPVQLEVIGIKGVLSPNIMLEQFGTGLNDVKLTATDTTGKITVGDTTGIVTAVSATDVGNPITITAEYQGFKDEIKVTVLANE